MMQARMVDPHIYRRSSTSWHAEPRYTVYSAWISRLDGHLIPLRIGKALTAPEILWGIRIS